MHFFDVSLSQVSYLRARHDCRLDAPEKQQQEVPDNLAPQLPSLMKEDAGMVLFHCLQTSGTVGNSPGSGAKNPSIICLNTESLKDPDFQIICFWLQAIRETTRCKCQSQDIHTYRRPALQTTVKRTKLLFISGYGWGFNLNPCAFKRKAFYEKESDMKVAVKLMLSMKNSLRPSSTVRNHGEPSTKLSKLRISSFT